MVTFYLSDSGRDKVGTETTLVPGHTQRAKGRGLKVGYKKIKLKNECKKHGSKEKKEAKQLFLIASTWFEGLL